MKIARQEDWLTAMVGEELVMMSAKSGRYIGLSAVGARVWELIESPRDVESVCSELEQEFDVAPDLCRAEVDAFVRELAKHGAVALDPATAG